MVLEADRIAYTVSNAAEALRGPLRTFLTRPDPTGIWLHVRELGVDVTLHVAHERPGAYHWTCSCGHEAHRSQPAPGHEARPRCTLCNERAPHVPAFHGNATFRTYRWAVRWPKPGKEGFGLGPAIDQGVFNDDQLLRGLGDVHHVLTHGIPELERTGLTNMTDYRKVHGVNPTIPVGGSVWA